MLYTLKVGDTVEIFGTASARNKRRKQLEYLESGEYSGFESILKKYNGLNFIVKSVGGGLVDEGTGTIGERVCSSDSFTLVKIKKLAAFLFACDGTEARECENLLKAAFPDKPITVLKGQTVSQMISYLGKTPLMYSEAVLGNRKPQYNSYKSAIKNLRYQNNIAGKSREFYFVKEKNVCLFLFGDKQLAQACANKLELIAGKKVASIHKLLTVDAANNMLKNERKPPVVYIDAAVADAGFSVNANQTVYDDAIAEVIRISGCDHSNDAVEQAMYTFYVDGSYSKKTNRSGAGVVVLNGADIIVNKHFEEVHDKEFKLMRNVSGELAAATWVLNYIINKKIKNAKIYCDYEGLIKWADKTWTPSKFKTKEYAELYEKASNVCNISFGKIKSHSGNTYNDMADKLAKSAIGLK